MTANKNIARKMFLSDTCYASRHQVVCALLEASKVKINFHLAIDGECYLAMRLIDK